MVMSSSKVLRSINHDTSALSGSEKTCGPGLTLSSQGFDEGSVLSGSNAVVN